MKAVAAVLLLLASTAAWAASCPTDDSKMDAISDFIDEHYGLAFSMINSPPEDMALFEVEFWLYDEAEAACKGTVRVADDCAVSNAEIACS